MRRPPLSKAEFLSRGVADPATGCLNWPELYGQQKYKGVKYMAHRLAWVLTHGAIQRGWKVKQRCGNKCCMNIEHLYLKFPYPASIARRGGKDSTVIGSRESA